ncbi:hypothetical protein CR513_04206, partial [Mucuna pruriens]
MQVPNLRREFEVLKIKESEIVKEFPNRHSKVVTQIKLLAGWKKILKVLLWHIQKEKAQNYYCSRKKQFDGEKEEGNKGVGWKHKFSPCPYCKKNNHTKNFYWLKPSINVGLVISLVMWKKFAKIKQANRNNKPNYSASNHKEVCLIDNECTNYMTHYASIFKELNQSYFSKVTIGNGESVEVKGKGVVVVETPLGTKYIFDVLYVPEIINLSCTIFDPYECELVRNKSFPFEWKKKLVIYGHNKLKEKKKRKVSNVVATIKACLCLKLRSFKIENGLRRMQTFLFQTHLNLKSQLKGEGLSKSYKDHFGHIPNKCEIITHLPHA